MHKDELANELHQEGAQDLLENGTLLRLAYNGHDGLPRVIPIGFLWNIVEGVPPEYLAAAKKSLNAKQSTQFEVEVTRLYDQMARISILPSWARFYDFGAGRLPSFLRDLIEQKQIEEES